MKNEYGAFIIKADAVRDQLTPIIISDIVESGFEIEDVMIHDRICPEQVDKIWTRNKGQEHVFKSLNHNFSLGQAVTVIVSQNGIKEQYPHETVHDSVVRVKGKPGIGGLRDKYQVQTRENLIAQGYTGDELLFKTGYTRIHGADSDEEFEYLTQALYTKEELHRLSQENPRLYQHLQNYVK